MDSLGSGDCVAYFCGDWIPAHSMKLSIHDVGFRQGVTAVERMRTYGGHVFRLADHLERFDATTNFLAIHKLPDRAAMVDLVCELLARNREAIARQRDVGITIFATPGAVGSADPTLALHLNPLNHSLNQQRQTQGQSLVITDVVQPPAASWPRSIKVRNRLHYYRADMLARSAIQKVSSYAANSDVIGVLVDDDGSVTETSIANVAIVEGQTIISPEPDQVLGGITQTVIEELAASESLTWKKERLSPDRFAAADEILCMGTDAGLWFANSVIVAGKKIESKMTRNPAKIYPLLLAGFAKQTSEPASFDVS
ncbi:aminotransferase class IV [Rhodopirellula maiorica SM1]|uniref:Aminotransferase class IV n=1 Tax=Rhodopirellula maiorica SM1 TaxID=1265738 RepID=M5RNR3_9BACT|nr:aminotransferase class IV [Rhodopirellula maiorica SM1]